MDAQYQIPIELAQFLKRRRPRFRCEDDEWFVELERPQGYQLKLFPPGALIIARSECGDCLFLLPDSAGIFGREVFAFWHEETPPCRSYCSDIVQLTNPPPPQVSKVPTVMYSDGFTPVLLGDQIQSRFLFLRREGKGVCVPGISIRNRNYEHGGLTWVAIRLSNGVGIAEVVGLESFTLHQRIKFIRRAE